jgi:uncharacterized lipoprotein YajG
MIGRNVLRPDTFLHIICVFMVALFVLSACGGSSTTTTTTTPNQPQPPIKIGISVSLSGDFSADGKATEQGINSGRIRSIKMVAYSAARFN